ncbi:hypothetical protein ACP70R_029353 [Stipagrostis hirtigluma subsp. patula]
MCLQPCNQTPFQELSPGAAKLMAAAVVACKRPAPDGFLLPAAAASSEKRARREFGNIADYEMLEELGEGAFGSVAKARDRRTGETVAVKWFRGDRNDAGAVVREAGCLAACGGHPSVVEMKEIATEEESGELFLVMEFVGPSLRSRLARRPFSEDETRASMTQLLGAAAKMHGAGIIHRDIKPENVLVGPGGELKLCDFGCATPARPLGAPYPGRRVGTVQYRSPEQLLGIRRYGPAVDVWALGCVMAELLVGVPLFTATAEEEVLVKILDLKEAVESVGLKAFEEWLELSPAGLEVLAGLLTFSPGERLTAADALKHRWFTDEEPPAAAKAE